VSEPGGRPAIIAAYNARVGTIFWVVFYLTISIDPTLASKIQQARDTFTDIKSITGPKA
jgi:hypothetical protein